jgi:hypothetical protein
VNRVLFYAPIVDDPLRPNKNSDEMPPPDEPEIIGEELPMAIEQAGSKNVRWRVETLDEANLVSSHVLGEEGMHAPVLDLDGVEPVGVLCLIQNWLAKRGVESNVNDFAIVASTSPGHFHLFCDVAMPWGMYSELLVKLGDRKMLEEGYVGVSLAREATFVRKPGHLKPEAVLETMEEVVPF